MPLKSEEALGLEAVVRWEHPERGLLHPEEFVPLAEETGLIVPIGRFVLEEACRRAREWQERDPADTLLTMGVNLSARQFRELGLLETVAEILDETGLEPCRLLLKITESAAMGDATATAPRLRKYEPSGCTWP